MDIPKINNDNETDIDKIAEDKDSNQISVYEQSSNYSYCFDYQNTTNSTNSYYQFFCNNNEERSENTEHISKTYEFLNQKTQTNEQLCKKMDSLSLESNTKKEV